jgi:hypothetical protein
MGDGPSHRICDHRKPMAHRKTPTPNAHEQVLDCVTWLLVRSDGTWLSVRSREFFDVVQRGAQQVQRCHGVTGDGERDEESCEAEGGGGRAQLVGEPAG